MVWQPPANSPSRVQAMEASSRFSANNPSKQWRMQTTNLSPDFTSSLVSEHKILTFNSKCGYHNSTTYVAPHAFLLLTSCVKSCSAIPHTCAIDANKAGVAPLIPHTHIADCQSGCVLSTHTGYVVKPCIHQCTICTNLCPVPAVQDITRPHSTTTEGCVAS